MAIFGVFYSLPIFGLFKQTLQFLHQYLWKMPIQYPWPGFTPKTSWTWVSSHNHWTMAPAQKTIGNLTFPSFPSPALLFVCPKSIFKRFLKASLFPSLPFHSCSNLEKWRNFLTVAPLERRDRSSLRGPFNTQAKKVETELHWNVHSANSIDVLFWKYFSYLL